MRTWDELHDNPPAASLLDVLVGEYNDGVELSQGQESVRCQAKIGNNNQNVGESWSRMNEKYSGRWTQLECNT